MLTAIWCCRLYFLKFILYWWRDASFRVYWIWSQYFINFVVSRYKQIPARSRKYFLFPTSFLTPSWYFCIFFRVYNIIIILFPPSIFLLQHPSLAVSQIHAPIFFVVISVCVYRQIYKWDPLSLWLYLFSGLNTWYWVMNWCALLKGSVFLLLSTFLCCPEFLV